MVLGTDGVEVRFVPGTSTLGIGRDSVWLLGLAPDASVATELVQMLRSGALLTEFAAKLSDGSIEVPADAGCIHITRKGTNVMRRGAVRASATSAGGRRSQIATSPGQWTRLDPGSTSLVELSMLNASRGELLQATSPVGQACCVTVEIRESQAANVSGEENLARTADDLAPASAAWPPPMSELVRAELAEVLGVDVAPIVPHAMRTAAHPSDAPVSPASEQREAGRVGQPSVLPRRSGSGRQSASPLRLRFEGGHLIELLEPIILGRNPTRQHLVEDVAARPITVADPNGELSRNHAQIVPAEGGAVVEDLGSLNGTFLLRLDGSTIALAPHEPALVEIGETIILAGTISGVVESG